MSRLKECIHIHVPTFRNKQIFLLCLNTWLQQTHEDISIHIYDNSLAENYHGIKDICNNFNDPRIDYKANPINIGAVENYKQIFNSIRPGQKSIILPADSGLEKDAIEKMLDKMIKSNCMAVYGGHKLFRLGDDWEDRLDDSLWSNSFEKVGTHSEDSICSGIDIIKDFYNSANIRGEQSTFCFAGPLIEGTIFSLISKKADLYRFHGFEQLITLRLLLNLKTVYLSSDMYYLDITGHDRLGDTERPKSHLTRLEPILATEEFLEENHLLLHENGIDIATLQKGQLNKIMFFIANYSGFDHIVLTRFIKSIFHVMLGACSKLVVKLLRPCLKSISNWASR